MSIHLPQFTPVIAKKQPLHTIILRRLSKPPLSPVGAGLDLPVRAAQPSDILPPPFRPSVGDGAPTSRKAFPLEKIPLSGEMSATRTKGGSATPSRMRWIISISREAYPPNRRDDHWSSVNPSSKSLPPLPISLSIKNTPSPVLRQRGYPITFIIDRSKSAPCTGVVYLTITVRITDLVR